MSDGWRDDAPVFVCSRGRGGCKVYTRIDPESTCTGCGSSTSPEIRFPQDVDPEWTCSCGFRWCLEHSPAIHSVRCRDCGLIQGLEPDMGQQELKL